MIKMRPGFGQKNKFNSRKTLYQGHYFHSKMEANRYKELLLLRTAKEIEGEIELQPYFILQDKYTDNEGKKHPAITYTPDFRYYSPIFGCFVIEEVKGCITEAYSIRKRLFLKLLPENTIFREIFTNARKAKRRGSKKKTKDA